MQTKEKAILFAVEWVAAWNAHDLNWVMSHYTDEFEMTSPYIISVANEASGSLKGKDKVGAYWAKALAGFPDLHFELIDVLYSVDSVTIYYRSVSNNRTVAEVFHLNEEGKVYKAISHYG